MSSRKNVTAPVRNADVPLPAIDWRALGEFGAPTPLPVVEGQLPQVDVVLVTWTSAEWSALDHVFLNSGSERQPGDDSWRKNWLPYFIETPSGWAYPMRKPAFHYQAVAIERPEGAVKVCLIKSEEHLAYEPFIEGLSLEIQTILDQCGADMLISAGTAGAANMQQPLGAVVSTSAAALKLSNPENLPCAYNDTTITCTDRFTSAPLYQQVAEVLMMPLNQVWNAGQIEQSVAQLNQQCGTEYSAADLINAPLNPAELTQGYMQLAGTLPLLTTDEFYISSPDDAKRYSCMEMDDAVLAHICQQQGVGYGSIRNISDPVVPYLDQSQQPIPEPIRNQWSQDIYEVCGLYTSYNGALGCWAALNTMDLSRHS